MILVIDIGNTLVNFGIFDERELVLRYSLPSTPRTTVKKCWEKLQSFMTEEMKIEGTISCSVVPGMTEVIDGFIKAHLRVQHKEFRNDSNVGIINRYDVPQQVGADRLVNALAVKELYSLPAIIVDLGTAITIDLVSANSEYIGGVISPGLGISAEALHKKTALLPRAELVIPNHVVGRDTASSLQSGLTYGFAGLVKSLVSELKSEPGFEEAAVIVTGGYTRILEPLLHEGIAAIDENLTLKGLSLAYDLI